MHSEILGFLLWSMHLVSNYTVGKINSLIDDFFRLDGIPTVYLMNGNSSIIPKMQSGGPNFDSSCKNGASIHYPTI